MTRKNLLRALNLALILLLFGGLFYYVNFPEILTILRTASLLPLLLAVLAGLLAGYVSSIELWILARKQGLTFSINDLFFLNLSARFYSFFSPLSSIGTFVRWQRLSGGEKPAEGLVTIAFNRTLDILVAICAGLFWGIAAIGRFSINLPLVVSYLVGFMAGIWWLLKASANIAGWAEQRAKAASHPILKAVFRFIVQLFLSLSVYKTFSVSELLILALTALIGELVSLLTLVLIAVSVHITIPIVDLGWMRPLLFLASLSPFTLAGGIGIREVSAVVIMVSLGIASGQAVAFSLLSYARAAVVSLIGGGVELVYFFSRLGTRAR